MTPGEAADLVALLKAAHATKTVPAATVELFASRLEPLHYEVAREAVLELVDDLKYWPTVAEIKKAYGEVSSRRRAQEPPEPLPEVSEEERARMLPVMREYLAKIGRPIPMVPDRNGHDPDEDIPLP